MNIYENIRKIFENHWKSTRSSKSTKTSQNQRRWIENRFRATTRWKTIGNDKKIINTLKKEVGGRGEACKFIRILILLFPVGTGGPGTLVSSPARSFWHQDLRPYAMQNANKILQGIVVLILLLYYIILYYIIFLILLCILLLILLLIHIE